VLYKYYARERLQDRRPARARRQVRWIEVELRVVDSAAMRLRDAFAPGHDHTGRGCSGVCTPTSQVPRRIECYAVELQLYRDTPSL
jgi:hypothetical protein